MIQEGEAVTLSNGREYICFSTAEENGKDYVYLMTLEKPIEVRFAEPTWRANGARSRRKSTFIAIISTAQ